MGKVFGILLVVLGIWIGMEVYLKGTDQALGGALGFLEGSGAEVGDRRTTPQRAGDAARRAHRVADERRNRLLGEE
jgi:hypothetical protein